MKTEKELKAKLEELESNKLFAERCDCGCEDESYFGLLSEVNAIRWALNMEPRKY